MLVLDNLSKSFVGIRAVDGVSLTVGQGSFVGIIGRSGAGKSTLLRLINRLNDPTAGRIVHDDVDVTALKGRPLRHWRRR
ncbi:ATP-binding cassette domain-containing protein, partial [Mycobacterium tuberculosis]|nr:ATP-binding cassette domain-containing protein [Mycobacterium tuberculosis]